MFVYCTRLNALAAAYIERETMQKGKGCGMEELRKIKAVTGLLLGCILFLTLYSLWDVQAMSPQLQVLPLYGKVIGVDPGHGGYDGGCVSVTGVAEKEYNLAVALLVGEEIRALGGTPVFTRETDKALIDPEKTTGYKKRKELDNRIALLQEAHVDALVSIHMNNYTVSKYRGAQLFYRADSAEGERLALCLQEALSGLEEAHLREPSCGDYYILNACDAALLVECGFLSNPEEEKLLSSQDYRQRLAEAVAGGLAAYFAPQPAQEAAGGEN